jgi:predicted phosphoribosyltransferase
MAEPKIISTSGEQFTNREEAGKLLAEQLSQYRGQHPVVLGIPRGGVVVACALARALGTEPDIVLSRKLRTPNYPELAMGAISEDGRIFLNERVVEEFSVSSDDMEREKERQLAEIRRRSEIIRRCCPKIPRQKRVVIIADDGVATGATFQAALWVVRDEDPTILVAAISVGSEEPVRRLANEADELVCLRVPPLFAAVGQFYSQFEAVKDEDVLEILKEGRKKVGMK